METHPDCPPTRTARTDTVLVVLAWSLLLLAQLIPILVTNHGGFSYTMDDPYIHMAVAEEIARGHYGVNPQEASSPSSSPIWPLLLVPLARTPLADFTPLVLNATFGLLAALLALRRIRLVTAEMPASLRRDGLRAGLVLAFLLATNAVGLVFNGMEHSLQVLMAMLVVDGILSVSDGTKPSRLFLLALVIGPWVRYENLALTAAGCGFLFFTGRKPAAFACGALAAAGLAAFSLTLVHLGLPPVPCSVTAKYALLGGHAGLPGMLHTFWAALHHDRGVWLALLAASLLGLATFGRLDRPKRLAALFIAAAGLLHLCFGTYGWFNRYEAYIYATELFGLFGVAGFALRGRLQQVPPVAALAGLPLLVVLALPYLKALPVTPRASNNIYQQQYQMHRFITEAWHQPVAVNDLGWVGYHNDAYVLDLWGLGSQQALQARTHAQDASWMSELCAQHGVKLAMIYDNWFPGLPPSWQWVGQLRFAGLCVTPANNKVSFYATDPAAADELTAKIREFRRQLPAGATLLTADEILSPLLDEARSLMAAEETRHLTRETLLPILKNVHCQAHLAAVNLLIDCYLADHQLPAARKAVTSGLKYHPGNPGLAQRLESIQTEMAGPKPQAN